jgi:hypothetical protein
MSVLETPRIFFKGQISWDPIVTNNTASNYDENTGETVFPAVADRVKAFRQQAIGQVTTGGNWNPDGTHRVAFYNSAICGVDVGKGVETADRFMGAAVEFTGMLVDLEPYGAYSSQLFFDSMLFGVDGGYRIRAPRRSRITARYINFARNTDNQMIAGIASVVWQTSFPKSDGLRVDAFDSTALQHLSKALEAEDVLGITVRFNAYRTVYFGNPNLKNNSPLTPQAAQELASKLGDGGFQPNPARSLLVGVIGLWRKHESGHEPSDRALLQTTNPSVGTAYARLGPTALALDLSNSVQEIDADLKKQDLGTLSVVAVDPTNQMTTELGTIAYSQYDRAAYEASAGIVTLSLTPGTAAAVADKDIQVLDANKNVLLAETALRAIPYTPNLYLVEGESAAATFQVYNRGIPVATSLPVTMYTMSSDGSTIDNVTEMNTNTNGVLSLPLVGTAGGGISAFVPLPSNPDQAPTQGINTLVNTYMYVRTLPADANIGMKPPTWDNVYANVLANWNAMAPCMDNWLRLDDPVQVKAYAQILKRLTDPTNFEHFRFMPVTRDMTPGERTLLYNFLDAPDHGPAVALGNKATGPNYAELSRAMRGGRSIS